MNAILEKSLENEEHTDQKENYLPTRTVLYNLEPIGIGTPYVESLSSYIARLAEKHNVKETVMLREVFGPLIKNENIKKHISKFGTVYREYLINGISAFSLENIRIIEELTGRKDIQYTTMINWGGLFNKNVVNSNRRWCSLCLESFRKELGLVYEPLLWAVSDIKICDKHQIELKEFCPHCKKKLSYISSSLLVGHCQYCLKWLGEPSSYENKILSEDQKFILKNYKQLFEVAPSLKVFPNKNYIGNRLKKLIGQIGLNNGQQFSKFLEVNNAQMFCWLNNKSGPSPEKLLHIAKKLNCTIYDIILDENFYLNVKVDSIYKIRKVSKITKEEMENHLRNAAYTNSTPKSLPEVCREVGISLEAAKNNFPNLSKMIVDNFSLHRKKSIFQRKKDIEVILTEILIHKTPMSLNKSLGNYGLSIKLAKKYHPELCEMIIERNQQYIKAGKEKRIKDNEDEIKSIILNLHQKGIYPSHRRINKEISNPNIFREEHFRTSRRQILKSLGYEM